MVASKNCGLCGDVDQAALLQEVLDHANEESGRVDWLAAKRAIPHTTTVTELKLHVFDHVQVVEQDE